MLRMKLLLTDKLERTCYVRTTSRGSHHFRNALRGTSCL